MRKKELPDAPVLLVQSGYDRQVTRDPTSEPAVGLGGLAAYCAAKGISADIFDFQVQSQQEFDSRVRHPALKLIGFSAATHQVYRAAKLAADVREKCPGVVTLLGGMHASALPADTVVKFPVFDYVAVGEGEETLVELSGKVLSGKSGKDIAGVAWQDEGKPLFGPARELIDDLDRLPHPDRSLMHLDRYVPNFSAYRGRPVTGVLSSRGCPFQCKYCSVRKLYGNKFRTVGIDWLVEELEICIRDYYIRDIFIYDDTFNIPKWRVEKVCEMILKKGLRFSWTCYGRADELNFDLMKLMKKAGCFQIRFGFEVGSDKRLALIGKKKLSTDSIKNVVAKARRAGIETYSNFILGLPEETEEEAEQTIEFARNLLLDSFSFCTFYPYPGAPFSEELAKAGRLSPYLGLYPDFNLEGLFVDYKPDPTYTSEKTTKRRVQFERLVRKGFIRCATHPVWVGRKCRALLLHPVRNGRFLLRGAWRFFHRFVIGTKTR